jgi:hypothetical protein
MRLSPRVRMLLFSVCIASLLGGGAHALFGSGSAAPVGTVNGRRGGQLTDGTLYDYLVMNVCVDAAGRITDEDPLHCPLDHQRDLRPGEAVPYFHADYPAADNRNPCYRDGYSRKYAFPLGLAGSDQTGASYPLVISWTDYTPSPADCEWNKLASRSTVSVLAVSRGFGSILGSYTHGKYYASLSGGYTDPTTAGVARFSPSWAFPETIPPLNGIAGGLFKKKTMLIGESEKDAAALPAHDPNLRIATTIQWWKHMMVVYGPPGRPTRALDSIVQFGFAKSNRAGDAPGNSGGGERLYLTRELGYVTRWEDWLRDDAKNVVAKARRMYDYANCSIPANIDGEISPHFRTEAVVDDTQDHTYHQLFTTIDEQSAQAVSHVWYLVGCHDYTNVHRQSPFDPLAAVNAQTLGTDFLNLFGAKTGPR